MAERKRRLAVCFKCKRRREGWTQIEAGNWRRYPLGRAIHCCDECRAAIVERPLAEVLFEAGGVEQ